MVVIMYCTKCGVENSDVFNYCSNCGAELIKELDFSDCNKPVEENWNDIVYSSDKSVPFKNQEQNNNIYGNYNQEYQNPQSVTEKDLKFNKMSIAGFVLACCAFLTREIGFVCAILGLIFSIIGLTSINKRERRGKGLAIAGIVLSGAYLLLIIYVFLLFGVMFAGAFWNGY